ncbi:class I SAM-dependent methyltransferase [Herbihabitans rhizosphaerae]|uniref:class I SAM-dependent methyltransferase n=1 Tax=Herbihabitans rhizosphaerae TaxID=1872711 RepID=UPI001F5EAEA2|nr:class I SAM-dependent methyltransferase [Herbihabitans rhizosphaerae]
MAKPYFEKLVGEYVEEHDVPVVNVLDIGCSYGINAALLKCDLTMDALYERYAGAGAESLRPEELRARDRDLLSSHDAATLRFTGLDVSLPALNYAHEVGFLDAAIHADLEERDPTPEEREQLAGTDVVFSTGCVGYVTHKTLARVVRANGGRKPWMAHFVLRMFPFTQVAECLAELGYETIRVDDEVFKQRRFASAEEQAQVLDTLVKIHVDPDGLESEGWMYAGLYISRPTRADDE